MADTWICTTRVFPFLFVSFLLVAAIAQPSRSQTPDRTRITDVRINSPEELGHIEKGSVRVENGRIVRVERKTGAKKPAGVNGSFRRRTVSYSAPDRLARPSCFYSRNKA
jgi:hypothetical protein